MQFVAFPHDFVAEVLMDAKTASSGRLSQKDSILGGKQSNLFRRL